jgi:hypothetical protein
VVSCYQCVGVWAGYYMRNKSDGNWGIGYVGFHLVLNDLPFSL